MILPNLAPKSYLGPQAPPAPSPQLEDSYPLHSSCLKSTYPNLIFFFLKINFPERRDGEEPFLTILPTLGLCSLVRANVYDTRRTHTDYTHFSVYCTGSWRVRFHRYPAKLSCNADILEHMLHRPCEAPYTISIISDIHPIRLFPFYRGKLMTDHDLDPALPAFSPHCPVWPPRPGL